MKKVLAVLLIVMLMISAMACSKQSDDPDRTGKTVRPTRADPSHTEDVVEVMKPLIYLYPQEQTDVSVRLDYAGELASTYPHYRDGWQVTASPDGTLINHADGLEYSYLFWEGKEQNQYDFSRGFCVAGQDTLAFLQDALPKLGLIPREYNEMIVYWLPLMENNAYNLISFQQERYTDQAKLLIEPQPDRVIRVFMAWQSVPQQIGIEAQDLADFGPTDRSGFTAVEWGGAECK